MPAITTVETAVRLEAQLKSLRQEARQTSALDDAAGYGPDIANALLRMDKDDVTFLTTANEIIAFLIIARYYALVRIASLIATRVDTHGGYAEEGDRQGIFDNVADLVAIAVREALAYGYVLQVTNLSQVGDANQPVDQTGDSTTWGLDAINTEWSVASEDVLFDYGEFL